MAIFTKPNEIVTAGFYRSADFDYAVRSVLGHAPSGASEPGEVFTTIASVADGDVAAWIEAWQALGLRLSTTADELKARGHFESASGMYLRAASYLSIAVRSSEDEMLSTVFREHRAAWDGFIECTVYSADQVEIPYGTDTMPGYLVRPSDDDEPRPTLILNGGSEDSHSGMWGNGAHGALNRGYNVLFFDGPGQQSMLFDRGRPARHDWEAVITPVVDFLVGRNDVDATKLAIYGIGQGGYWVPRALAFEKRIAAAIVDPAVVDVSSAWTAGIARSTMGLHTKGKREAFDKDMEIGMRFAPDAARSWRIRARTLPDGGYFDKIAEIQKYTLVGIADRISTPILVTSAEGEQFWPGQSERFVEVITAPNDHAVFTASEGAGLHGQPLGRTLTEQRMFDWLDEKLGLVE